MQMRFLLLFSLLMFSISTYAIPQQVEACLQIDQNISAHSFAMGFVSSDLFDDYRRTYWIENGLTCTHHLYNYGPKNIKFFLTGGQQVHDLLVIPDGSCGYIRRLDNVTFESDYVRLFSSFERVIFNLVPGPFIEGYRHTFVLYCQHQMNGVASKKMSTSMAIESNKD